MRDDGVHYAERALTRELKAVTAAAQGGRNALLNRAAYALGGLIASGHLQQGDVEQRLMQAALDAGLDRVEASGTLRSGLRAGMRKPRAVPARTGPVLRTPILPSAPAPHGHDDVGDQRRRNAARSIWRETRPAAGSVVDLWLAARGIRFAIPSMIRHHPALPYRQHGREIGRWPAMVVRMDDPAGNFSGAHRTYLDGEATPNSVGKAPVEPARMMLGNAGIAWFGRRDADGIIVGEGVETVLSASELGGASLPLWGCSDVPDDKKPRPGANVPPEPYGLTPVACFTAGGLASFEPPVAVRRMFICEDADPAGRGATAKLAAKAQGRGIAVNTLRCRDLRDGC
ncbi:MAG: toprim domain-containing protein [Rhodospirillales bacterium]|nr:toprim domain-containing protein [Rhodospirillales bacterium]